MNILSFEQALTSLQSNNALIYPTETFYALGCNALSRKAVASIYQYKQRNNNQPLPIIIGSIEQLKLVTSSICNSAELLINNLWPGPLSILFAASPSLPAELTAGTGYVAVRLSSHPAASKLSLACNRPLVSSSANLSGQPAITSLSQLNSTLLQNMGGNIYNAPPVPAGGVASTIIKIDPDNNNKLIVLRDGAIPRAKLSALGFELV